MKAVSIVSIVYGTLGLIWAAVAILLIRLQAVFFKNFPLPEEVSEIVDLPVLLDSVYSVIGVLFPFVFLIALLYILSAILQLSGKSSFKNLAYTAAFMNIVWYISYIVLMQVEIVPVLNSLEFFPENLMGLIVLVGMVFNAVFYCGYPVFLIIFIRRGGKEWDTLNTNYTS